MRRIFYDTEFIDDGETIELISIGMVDEEGNELYYVNSSCLFERIIKRKWLRENVLPYLPAGDSDWLNPLQHPELKSKPIIAHEVKDFILGLDRSAKEIELWAYFGAYDHVALAQLWGPMINLPSGIPMFTHDIKQEMNRLGVKRSHLDHLDKENDHKAIDDARWNREVWFYLRAQEITYKHRPEWVGM